VPDCRAVSLAPLPPPPSPGHRLCHVPRAEQWAVLHLSGRGHCPPLLFMNSVRAESLSMRRLTAGLMMHGRNNGKKIKAVRIVLPRFTCSFVA